jgi:hypothetical protein
MENIYIIDYAGSRTNGIGSYIRELTYCLLELGVNVCLIVLNYETDRFSITHEDGVKKILFPPIRGSYFNNCMTFNFFFGYISMILPIICS